MPSLGADMLHGTLVRWNVHAGDTVHRGDIVGEVETDKGVFDIDSLEDGIVEELLVAEGARVPVQAPLARLRTSESHAAAPGVAAPAVEAARHRVSPLARRVAAELGVDLAAVRGTGDGGAITRADVERAAHEPREQSATVPIPRAVERPLPTDSDHRQGMQTAMRDAIGAAMSRSKREIPHYYLSQEMDVSRLKAWLRDINATRPVPDRILAVAVLLATVARALPGFPEFNGQFIDGAFRPSEAVHLGIAVAMRGGGLIAPALRDAVRLSPQTLMPALLDLVARTRTSRLRTSELTDATITITALAEGGVREVFGVIYPPQVAIIGFGAIADRPWAVDGLLGVRQTVVVTLAADHRVSDGHRGALLLAEIQRLLLSPETL